MEYCRIFSTVTERTWALSHLKYRTQSIRFHCPDNSSSSNYPLWILINLPSDMCNFHHLFSHQLSGWVYWNSPLTFSSFLSHTLHDNTPQSHVPLIFPSPIASSLPPLSHLLLFSNLIPALSPSLSGLGHCCWLMASSRLLMMLFLSRRRWR